MEPIFLALIFGSFLVLILFYRHEKYDTLNGILLFGVALSLLFMKSFMLGNRSLVFIPSTFLISGLVTLVATIFVAIILFLMRKYKPSRFEKKYILILLVLYIIFGFLQQLFFQFVFLETIYSITKSFFPAIIISAFYYSLFHLRESTKRFFFGTLALGIIYSTIYLLYGNLIWLGISHGILGTIYYVYYFKEKILENKIGYFFKIKF